MKKTVSIIKYLLLAFLIILLLTVIVSRVSGKTPEIFGLQMNVIVTPSMEPELKVGDLIVSRTYKGGELHIGDIVTYLCPQGEMQGKLITHKIIQIDENGDRIITQGVAMGTIPDAPITKNDICSVLIYKTIVLKFIYRIITNKWGFLLLVIIPLLLMIVSEMRQIFDELKKGDKADEKKEDNHIFCNCNGGADASCYGGRRFFCVVSKNARTGRCQC